MGSQALSSVFRLRDIVNVKDPLYGAKGDGTTDDSAAILAAVNAAAGDTGSYENDASVYFPPGVYRITQDAVLTPSTETRLRGLHFYGAGWYTSILQIEPSGSDIYFYNNGATARMSFATFSDLGFRGMDPRDFSVYTDIDVNAKGFRLYSATAIGSHEQGFKFNNCLFTYLGTGFEFRGDNTASEVHFVNCKIAQIRVAVYNLQNNQSFNHEFHGTDIEVIYGDVFVLGPGTSGGAIKMYGGSVILFSDTGVNTYFLRATHGVGANSYPYSFNGIRFETRGNTANIVNIATLFTFHISFNDCYFLSTATADLTDFVAIGAYANVLFKGCTFNEQGGGQFKFHITAAARYGISGAITFKACALPVDWSDRCTTDGIYGQISAIDCFGTSVGAQSGGVHYAHDFDLHSNEPTPGQFELWDGGAGSTNLRDGGSPMQCNMRLKTAQIKMPAEFWPDTSEHTLKLPKNAIIKNIYLRKPPFGTDATAGVVFRVGRNDKTGTDHVITNAARMRDAHSGEAINYFYCVGDDTNERTLRLYTNENPVQNGRGGLCFVEYY